MMRKTRALAIVSAALSVAACGAADEGAGGGPDDSTVDTGTTDGGLRAPTPVRAVGGGPSGGATAESATLDAAPGGEASAGLLAFVEYVLGDVGELPANSTGYVFPAGAGVDADRVAVVAAALGVEGQPVAGDPDLGTSWRVGPTDGSAPSLTVGSDAQLGWWYSPAWSEIEGRAVEACTVSIDSDGAQVEDCPEPEPPVGVPTGADAEQRVRALLTSMGHDPDAFEYHTFADEWFANVRVTRPLDAVVSPLSWGFGFGENGVLQYANGSFAVPEPVGPYPLVDLDTAFARLQDRSGFFGGGIAVAEAPVAIAEADVAPDDATAVVVDDEPAPPPEPAPPVDLPEPITVTLIDVEADLWWAWAEDGAVWLLPAYRFIDDGGGWHVVPAVTDEFLIVVEPEVPEPAPMPVEPAPAPDPSEPDESLPIDPSPVTVPEPTATVPVDVREGDVGPDEVVVELGAVLPMPIDELTELAAGLGFTVRVVVRDGEPLAVTADYSETRLNVEVDGEVVVRLRSVG